MSKNEKNKKGRIDDKFVFENEMLAVILVRGLINVDHDRRETIKRIGFQRKHNLVVLPKTKSNLGMVQKIKDYVTYGIINKETLDLLLKEKKPIIEKKNKLVFNLHPPRGGFERKGIKTPFKLGGVLGDRGEKINDLIKKML